MPLYDYACTSCGHRIEVLHGREEPGPTTCTVCGGPMRKVVGAPAVVFKGSGWAKRDRAASRSGSDGAATKGAESGDSKVESGAAAGAKGSGDGADGASGAAGSTKESSSGKDGPSTTSSTKAAESSTGSKESKGSDGAGHASKGSKPPAGGGPG